MFCEFHRYINAYDHSRYCQCKACTSAINLTLKVITHYGEFTSYNVKNFSKLIGKDVIVAHQLLKNDIDQHEYWLVTKNMVHDNGPADFARWMKWNSSAKQTETGEISFVYTQLSELKNEIPPETLPKLGLSENEKIISASKEYETDIISLFNASGDFSFRNRWWQGVKKVEEVNHFLPRVGMKCRCILENGQAIIYSSSYSYSPEKIEFSETDEKRKIITYYTLEKVDDHNTRLTLDLYVKKNAIGKLIFNLTEKKKYEDIFQKSMSNLSEAVKEIRIPANIE